MPAVCYNFPMKTTILKYNVIIRKEGSDYVAYTPTLGVSDFGKSTDIALANVRLAIETHLEGLTKTGTEIPSPRQSVSGLS
ncbi:MAG: hypothetical protein UV74_C0013G0596 [Candidatus Woesebacteria bacterium GW2011_GWB1_43_14]|uniref:HicB-like antitoxin of toxin-antitoxin system domain-containing protein n=1 Tax=Candidatus Woesebacteria bacterium GW2011_GWB1_43_14 TaxID=1618578 RepID=A0A0G1DIF5_9BACT|nr:MAG: hypothetical protein UV74_C0013G0596 [Candidatus Woesebacteria bacterium GW2011_GWB1_43_14]